MVWIRVEQSEGEEGLIQLRYEDIERGRRKTTKVRGSEGVERGGFVKRSEKVSKPLPPSEQSPQLSRESVQERTRSYHQSVKPVSHWTPLFTLELNAVSCLPIQAGCRPQPPSSHSGHAHGSMNRKLWRVPLIVRPCQVTLALTLYVPRNVY